MNSKPSSDAILLNLSDDHGSHLINSRRWRDQRFGPATRREEGLPAEASAKEGACPNGPVTDEQRSGRPKDRSFPGACFSYHFAQPSFFLSGLNATAGIYEMASKEKLRENLLAGMSYLDSSPVITGDHI